MITYSDTIAKNVEIAMIVPRSRIKSNRVTSATLEDRSEIAPLHDTYGAQQ